MTDYGKKNAKENSVEEIVLRIGCINNGQGLELKDETVRRILASMCNKIMQELDPEILDIVRTHADERRPRRIVLMSRN